MPFLLSAAAGAFSRVALSGAALVASLGFLKGKAPAPPQSGLTAYQAGTLALYALGIFMIYKLIKDALS